MSALFSRDERVRKRAQKRALIPRKSSTAEDETKYTIFKILRKQENLLLIGAQSRLRGQHLDLSADLLAILRLDLSADLLATLRLDLSADMLATLRLDIQQVPVQQRGTLCPLHRP